jgi:hypothetical protein
MENKTHFKKLRNPSYIGSYELMVGNGSVELNVTIERATKEMVQNGDKKEEAMVIYLKGHKPMIVNSTNAKNISKALNSPYIEDWVGKEITLYVAKIKAFGEHVDALRVKTITSIKQLPKLEPNTPNFDAVKTALSSGKFTIEQVKSKYQVSDEVQKLLQNGK